MKKLQADAAIVPNCSLGGFQLRTSILEIQDSIMDLHTRNIDNKEKPFRLSAPFEAEYKFEEEGITVCVDVRNGKIFRLTADSKYKGFLFDKIYVGMTIADAFAVEPELYYDEAMEVIYSHKHPGLAIDIPENDPPPEEVPQMVIHAINVYAQEAFKPMGNGGLW